MEWRPHAAARWQTAPLPGRRRGGTVALALLAWAALGGPAAAASLSARDVQVMGRALAFLQPPPASGELAVIYADGNAASKQDAEAIAAELGDGLHVGSAVLRPRLVASTAVAMEGFAVAIAATGANGPPLRAAIDAKRALCVTADLAAVEAGSCTMAIRSEPRVEIVVNHAAAVASGVEFVAAFRMMIREI